MVGKAKAKQAPKASAGATCTSEAVIAKKAPKLAATSEQAKAEHKIKEKVPMATHNTAPAQAEV